MHFYLRARGISKKEAHCYYMLLLMMMQNIDIEPLKKISKLLAEKLEVNIEFEDLD
jgi:Fe-S cluster assembly protein SufD